jgi:hypothetical protein
MSVEERYYSYYRRGYRKVTAIHNLLDQIRQKYDQLQEIQEPGVRAATYKEIEILLENIKHSLALEERTFVEEAPSR